MLFAAVHESAPGTSRTLGDVQLESARGAKRTFAALDNCRRNHHADTNGNANQKSNARLSMRRCHRHARHRHSLPSARQSPFSPCPAPSPALVAAARAGCASAPPTLTVWVPASTRSCRPRGRSCGTSRRTCAAPTSSRAPSDRPTTVRPPATSPRAPIAATDCTGRAAISARGQLISRDTRPAHQVGLTPRCLRIAPLNADDATGSVAVQNGQAGSSHLSSRRASFFCSCHSSRRAMTGFTLPRARRRRRSPPARGTTLFPWLQMKGTRPLPTACSPRVHVA
jgi:hypothetical protein